MSSSSSSREPAAGSSSQGPSAAGGSSSVNFPTLGSSSSGSHAAAGASSQLTGDPAIDLAAMPRGAEYLHTLQQGARLKEQFDETLARLLASMEGHQRAEAEGEKAYTVRTEADVPGLVEALSSKEEKTAFEAAWELRRISDRQHDILHSAVLPLLPDILSRIFTATTEAQCREIVGLMTHIGSRTREAAAALEKHADLEALFGLLLKTSSKTTLGKAVIGLLEHLMQAAGGCAGGGGDGGKMESRVIEVLHTQFYTFETLEDGEASDGGKGKGSGKGKAKVPEAVKWNTAEAMNAITTFKHIMSRQILTGFCVASLKAGVLEFLLHVATTPNVSAGTASPPPAEAPGVPPTLSSLRAAAVSCLSQLYLSIVEQLFLPEDFPHLAHQVDGQFDLQGQILMPLLDMLDDPDLPVSDKIVDLLYARFNDLDQAVQIFLLTHEGGMRKLIRKLAIGSSAPTSDSNSGVEGKGKGKVSGPEAGRARPSFLESFGKNLGSETGPPGGQGPSGYSAAERLLAKYSDGMLPPTGSQGREENSAGASVLPATTEGGVERVDGMHVSTSNVDEGELGIADMLEIVGNAQEVDFGDDQGCPLVEMADGSKQVEDDMMDASGEAGRGANGTTDSEMKDLGKPEENKHQTKPVAKASPPPPHPGLTFNLNAPLPGLSDEFLAILNKANSCPKTEPLLSNLCKLNPDGVVEAFSAFWQCDSLEEGMREKLVQALSGVHGAVKVAAVSAGIPIPSGCEKMAGVEA